LAEHLSERPWAGLPTDAEADELLGRSLNDTYVIEAALGEGGMGRIYRARHTRIPQKLFAIKVLRPELARNPSVQARFQREAETAACISHPNVVGVYDVGRTADGWSYLVCEFLEGVDLAAHLEQRKQLDTALAVHVALQVCDALLAAHERNVVHRDLKPHNVFLLADKSGAIPALPTVKVLDFGLSRFLDTSDAQLTRTGVIMGTPAYMAPEQARAERGDHRVDIYGVGTVLYTALTGRAPFKEDTLHATVLAVMTSEPERPRSVNPDIPEALELVIQKAMAKDPKDRFASARATLDAIEAAAKLATEPATPGATPIVVAPAAPPPPVAVAPPPPVAAAPPPPAPQSGGTQRASSSRVVFMRAESLANPERSGDRGRLVLLAAVAIGFLTVLGTIALAVRGCGSSRTAAVDPPSAPSSSQPVVAAPLEGAPAAATEIPTPDASSVPVTNAPPASLDREASDAHERDREAHKRREKEERDARKRREKAEHEAHKHHKKAAKGHGKRGRH